MRELCKNCKAPFKRGHHWKHVYKHFLWFHWSYRVHHNCSNPEMGPHKVKRLPGFLRWRREYLENLLGSASR